jgi:hypothetical protein
MIMDEMMCMDDTFDVYVWMRLCVCEWMRLMCMGC